jgi:hypothetical protein
MGQQDPGKDQPETPPNKGSYHEAKPPPPPTEHKIRTPEPELYPSLRKRRRFETAVHSARTVRGDPETKKADPRDGSASMNPGNHTVPKIVFPEESRSSQASFMRLQRPVSAFFR